MRRVLYHFATTAAQKGSSGCVTVATATAFAATATAAATATTASATAAAVAASDAKILRVRENGNHLSFSSTTNVYVVALQVEGTSRLLSYNWSEEALNRDWAQNLRRHGFESQWCLEARLQSREKVSVFVDIIIDSIRWLIYLPRWNLGSQAVLSCSSSTNVSCWFSGEVFNWLAAIYNCLLQVGHQSLWLVSFTMDDEILLDEWKSLGGCSHFFAIAIRKETFGKRSLTHSQMSGTSLTIEILGNLTDLFSPLPCELSLLHPKVSWKISRVAPPWETCF